MQLRLPIVQKAVSVIAALCYVVAAITVILTGIAPLKYLLPVLVLSGIGVAVLVRASWRPKPSRRRSVVLIGLSVLLALLSVYIYTAARSISGFLDSMQPSDSYETYSIVAEKARHVRLDGVRSAGMLQTDPYLDEVKAGLAQKTPAEPKAYSDTTSIILALEKTQLDTAVFNSATMSLLEDNYAQFDTLEVLATFRIKVKAGQTADIDTSKPFAVYISGIDTYGGIATVSRSDVNMLAVVNPVQHKMLLVNTPRDYYVQLHGTKGTRDKLTHAGIYGIDMSRQTLEDLYGIPIGYYIRINFSSLVNIVDTIGGVDVYSERAFKSFRQGHNHLDGKRALEFARERYSFAEGDRQRGRNQQLVIEAIVSKLTQPSVAVKYQSILRSLKGALQTDMSEATLVRLANAQLNDMRGWYVESISVDGTSKMAPTYSMGSLPLYVMEPDPATVTAAKRQIAEYLRED